MRKSLVIFSVMLFLLSVTGCNKNNEEHIRGVAFASLTKVEKAELSNDKYGVVKKIKSLPENATIEVEEYNPNMLYSVTFNHEVRGEEIIIFVDEEKKRKVGFMMRK